MSTDKPGCLEPWDCCDEGWEKKQSRGNSRMQSGGWCLDIWTLGELSAISSLKFPVSGGRKGRGLGGEALEADGFIQ